MPANDSCVAAINLLEWLREQCAEYEFDVVALYRTRGDRAREHSRGLGG
jgi:hypothetical protein